MNIGILILMIIGGGVGVLSSLYIENASLRPLRIAGTIRRLQQAAAGKNNCLPFDDCPKQQARPEV